ncbi:MAG TPA: response regulator transcription factor [Puia sp.]|nr:response regulator transcription factor [Puia sp.]
MARLFQRYKYVVLYGAGLALLLFLLKWLEWRFIVFDHAIELYSAGIAILFTGLGIWLAVKLAKPRVVTIAVPAPSQAPDPSAATISAPAQTATPDPKTLAKLGISDRELEVLQLMAEGLSNQEIAARLFVSLNTIKTHSSRIFEKLDVRRRTQAVETARRLRLITDPIHPKA